mmetsp:Transcript_29107/g.53070  ORF Transcript_29107/g.53070 Transcript_29107/m.53070 type:complete len:98 (-) Transcript_29107:202-495(-)
MPCSRMRCSSSRGCHFQFTGAPNPHDTLGERVCSGVCEPVVAGDGARVEDEELPEAGEAAEADADQDAELVMLPLPLAPPRGGAPEGLPATAAATAR